MKLIPELRQQIHDHYWELKPEQRPTIAALARAHHVSRPYMHYVIYPDNLKKMRDK